MPGLHFVLPGDPQTRSGGFLYDRRVIAGLPRAGWQVTQHALPDGFPDPSTVAVAVAEALLDSLPSGDLVVIDGLALGVLPETARRQAERLRLVALVHHPLADESGLEPAREVELFRLERAALGAARHVIVTSPHTAERLRDFDVARESITVAVPGVDPAGLTEGAAGTGPGLLCAASLTPRKGHAVLIEALAGLTGRDWHLVCAGSTARDPETARRVQALCRERGLAGRVDFVGEVEAAALDGLYRRADLFVLPSFHEGYGMVLTEAAARGLPIVATRAGAIPETLPEGAGLLVPPGDPTALAETLAGLMDRPEALAELAAGARRARATLPTWDDTVARFAEGLGRAAAA